MHPVIGQSMDDRYFCEEIDRDRRVIDDRSDEHLLMTSLMNDGAAVAILGLEDEKNFGKGS